MRNKIMKILNEYLSIYPTEEERLSNFYYFLDSHNDEEIIDWNNFEGHVVASSFIYSIKDRKFLVLYHKDMKMYVYPGGHMDSKDNNPLYAAIREIKEETGVINFNIYKITENELVPLDIDTHIIEHNDRLDLPAHYHFDFRYLFTIDKIPEVKIDNEESRDYKWVDFDEINKITNCTYITPKIKLIIEKLNNEK